MGSLDRSLTLSFGAVVMALMALFLMIASVLSFQIQDKRQEFLATTLAGAVGEAVNRVNFYQMRSLVTELKGNLPGLGYVAVADMQGTILAHSQPELNGRTMVEVGLIWGNQSDFLWKGVHYLQRVQPLQGGLEAGVVGTILVGVSVEDLHQDQVRYLCLLALFSLAGTLTAMAVVFYLSHRFGGRVQTLARQLQGILDRAPVGIAIFDSSGKVIQKSRSFSSLTDQQDLVFPDSFKEKMDPAHYTTLEAQTAVVRAEGQDTVGECPLGAETWQLTQFPLGSGQTGLIAQDLTLRVVVERELVASRNQLNRIIDKSPVGICIVDRKSRRVLRVNECFEDTFGYSREAVPTLEAWFDLAFPEEPYSTEVRDRWSRYTEEWGDSDALTAPVEVEARCADGTRKTARVATALAGSVAIITFVDRTAQKKAEQSILEMNHTLEEKIQVRTEELEQTYRELMDTEKLAALGQLAAGMAHELNTPLGAIQAANRQNQEFLGRQFSGSLAYVAALGPDQWTFLQDLMTRNQELARALPPTPDRKKRREVLKSLEERNLDPDEDMAEYVLELGFGPSDLDRLASGPEFWEVFRRGREFLMALRMTRVVAEGTDKATHVVEALRRYLKGADEDEFALFPVADQLETILTLFQHKLKNTVEVIKDYSPDLQIYGDRQQLNQVWMNLIHNALQSMDYKGKLKLSVNRGNQTVEIRVTDTGPGVPEPIRDKIFTPYFTTKKRGEGMGLGLDLCRKIVQTHQGTIGFESQPGQTTFTVSLPLPQELLP